MNLRLFLLLLVLGAVICTALGVVYVRHESRGHAVALGQLENRKDQIIAEWTRLQLEQAMLADAGHIEQKAQDALGMREPTEPHILVIRP